MTNRLGEGKFVLEKIRLNYTKALFSNSIFILLILQHSNSNCILSSLTTVWEIKS